MTTFIALGRDAVALVDDADAEKVRGFPWRRHHNGRGVLYYARAEVMVDGKRIKLLMHRIILGAKPGEFSDHIDGDGLNNQRANLRLCTRSENARNSRKHKQSDRSPYKGVYRYGNSQKWIAAITDPTRRQQVTIGVFADPVAAAVAYDEQARRLFGEFAQPNFPLTSS